MKIKRKIDIDDKRDMNKKARLKKIERQRHRDRHFEIRI